MKTTYYLKVESSGDDFETLKMKLQAGDYLEDDTKVILLKEPEIGKVFAKQEQIIKNQQIALYMGEDYNRFQQIMFGVTNMIQKRAAMLKYRSPDDLGFKAEVEHINSRIKQLLAID